MTVTPLTIQKNAEDFAPAIDAVAVTPNDSTALPNGPCMQIYIGGTGDLKVLTANNSTTTFKAVPVGTTLNVRARQVFSTGTTATNIVALY